MSRNQEPGYWQNHARVIKAFGKASEYQCTLCFDAAQSWAYLHDLPTAKPTDIYSYVPFCRRCHIDYDQLGRKRPRQGQLMKGNRNRTGIKFRPDQNHGGAKVGNKARLGKFHSEETREKMSESHKAYGERLREEGKPHYMVGRKMSEETKAKMSASRLAYLERKRNNQI